MSPGEHLDVDDSTDHAPDALKGIGAAAASNATDAGSGAPDDATVRVTDRPVEIDVTPIGESIVRISVVPLEDGRPLPIPVDGSLVKADWGEPVARVTSLAAAAVDRLRGRTRDRVGRAADDSRRRRRRSPRSGAPHRPADGWL